MKTKDDLRKEIMMVPYVELEPHVQRASVIEVDESLDFLEVALSIAKDDKALISALIMKKLLNRATENDYNRWKNDKRFFNFIILQPYVLVQNATALKNNKSSS